MKVKIIAGFRKDQQYSIDEEEAHKAYYLFLNPDARTVFNSGLALKGSEVSRIEPDYQGSMGWNPTHTLDEDDMNEIRKLGVDRKLREVLLQAKEVAQLGDVSDLGIKLSDAVKKYPQLNAPD